MARICIVTPSNLYATPRVVKEADALEAAGHSVRVVYAQSGELFTRVHDTNIEQHSRWRAARVTYDARTIRGRLWWKLVGLRQKANRWLLARGLLSSWTAARAAGRLYPELAALAAVERADMFIGHYPTGLAAAEWAADRHGALLGYDLEDCYFIQHATDTPERIAIEAIERRCLPRVSHLTASTRLIDVTFSAHYGTATGTEVRNCFDPVGAVACAVVAGELPRCFWFSQVISLRRGLDVVLAALARCAVPMTLDLRGFSYANERTQLDALVSSLGLKERVRVLPPVAPDRLIDEAARYQIGFLAEVADDANRPLTAANKLFLYLAAGLAVAATDQPGQREAFSGSGDAARFYAIGDVDALVAILDDWALSPDVLSRAQAASRAAGQGDWSWREEQKKLVGAVERTLTQSARGFEAAHEQKGIG